MLTQLIYISRAVGPQTTTVTTQILETARAFNKSHDLTGVLCQGKGLYVQVLEGERSVFKDWSMALVNLSIDDPMVTMKHPEFDPYSADSRAIIGLITELLSSSSAIQTPG